MTKDDLKWKARDIRQYALDKQEFCKAVGITIDDFYIKQNGDFEIKDMLQAYNKGKEEKEKRIAELEEKIEKMMCCSNCKNCRRKFIKKNVFEHTCKVEHCKNYDKWEIKEND